MKQLIVVAIVGVTVAAFGAEKGKKTPLTAEEKAARKEVMLQHTGGIIRRPGTGAGKIVFINASKRIADADIAPLAQRLQNAAQMDFEVKHLAKPVDFTTAASELKASGGATAVFVTDLGTAYPPLVAVPDEKYALVNASVFPEKADAPLVQKEVLRAFAMASGAMSSQFTDSLMNPFVNLDVLAAYAVDGLPVDVFQRVRNHLKTQGVLPYQISTYKHGCREGWAPAPTNAYQKAIWDKVHEIPSKPIKIEYNEKRDKGK